MRKVWRQPESTDAIGADSDIVERITRRAESTSEAGSEVKEAKRDENETRTISSAKHFDLDLNEGLQRFGGIIRASSNRRTRSSNDPNRSSSLPFPPHLPPSFNSICKRSRGSIERVCKQPWSHFGRRLSATAVADWLLPLVQPRLNLLPTPPPLSSI